MLDQLAYIRDAQTGRASSWGKTGRNRAIAQRMPVRRDKQGRRLHDPNGQITRRKIAPNAEMAAMKKQWAASGKSS